MHKNECTATDHAADGMKTLTGARTRAGPEASMGAHAGLPAEMTARANTGAPATKKKRKPRSAKGKETNARRAATRYGGQGKA